MISLSSFLTEASSAKEKALQAFNKDFGYDGNLENNLITISGDDASGYEISYNGNLIIREGAKTLTNKYYKLGEVESMYIYQCKKISSLEGLPRKIEELTIEKCPMISSLDGAQNSEIKILNVRGCKNFTSLMGCPKDLNSFSFYPATIHDHGIDNLHGLPKHMKGDFNVISGVNSYEGMPEEIDGDFFFTVYKNMTGKLPKKIGGDAHIKFYGGCSFDTHPGLEYIGGKFATNKADDVEAAGIKVKGKIVKES